jgi:pyruvate,orthophosphate dikinase
MEFIIQYEGHSNRGLMSIGMQVGVCGEHGGEPSSVAFFAKIGLDYVSCSPFRWPFLLVLYCLVNTYHLLFFISADVFRILFQPNSFDFSSFITYMIHLLLPNYTSELLNGFTILFHL